MKKIDKIIFWQCIGMALFEICHTFATSQRGYQAIGGEGALLFLPFWIYVFKTFWQDLKSEYKSLIKDLERQRNERGIL